LRILIKHELMRNVKWSLQFLRACDIP
jgi:hypothetical protein